MCGIFGVVYTNPSFRPESDAVDRALASLRHRGPDDRGAAGFPGAVLGSTRLAIVDVAGGRQPFLGAAGQTALVHNGEVYNFEALRREFEAGDSRPFASRSDTEVVLRACERFGRDAPRKLRGMFAFAFYETHGRRLLLARDRLGVKPLYYALSSDRIVFASEPKAILAFDPAIPRTLDLEALDQFLTLEYVPAPRTLLHEIRKLPPAHTLEWKDGRATIASYWDISPGPPPASETIAEHEIAQRLSDAVRSELVSDVPLGVFLSGGIDSSIVAALVAKAAPGELRTFSLRIPDAGYDESRYARLVASRLGSRHHEIEVSIRPSDLLPDLVRAFDDPVADSSIFPTYLLSRETRNDVKAVLSGDGGDELFAGYDSYVAEKLSRLYGLLPAAVRNGVVSSLLKQTRPRSAKKGLINRAKRFAEGAALPEDLGSVRWMIFLDEAERVRLYGDEIRERLSGTDPYEPVRSRLASGTSARGALGAPAPKRAAGRARTAEDPIERALRVDLSLYLPDDILAKVDRTSMTASLEVRVPFLDHDVVEYAAAIPAAWKMKGLHRKAILRRAFRDLVPKEVLKRRKEGFSAPMKRWLREDLRATAEEALSSATVKRRGLFRPERVRELLDEHFEQRADHSHRLFALLSFELWCREHLDPVESRR